MIEKHSFPGFFAGRQIIVHPDTAKARRTWRSRLLSWPWRPWISHVEVPNPLFTRDEVYVVGDRVIMSQSQYDHFVKRA